MLFMGGGIPRRIGASALYLVHSSITSVPRLDDRDWGAGGYAQLN